MMTDKRMRRGLATILLFVAIAGLAASLVVFVTGGVTWPAARFSARDPWRPFAAGIVLLIVARAIVSSTAFHAGLTRYTGVPGRRAARVAALAAVCTFVYACAWSSRAAGGSDSSCYVLQAEAFAQGRATVDSPVAEVLGDAPNAVFAPIGFIPSLRRHGAAVPICPAGLSLAMVPAYLVHPSAVFLIVPASAAWLVWLTFVYGRRVDGDVTGACGAVLVACSPIVLYQSVQPMTDIPAAAAWMAAIGSASPIGAGVWASIAILIRPNMALLAVVLPALHRKRWAAFALGLVPGIAVVLALNVARYGAPLATGYGSTDALFTRAHVYANLFRYPLWVLETHTPFVLLALAAPWTLRRDPARARLAWASLAAAALLAATYMAYSVFDDWWYIRFLLPALPMMIVLSVSVLRSAAARLGTTGSRAAVTVAVAALAIFYVRVARERHAMDLQALESRFALAGEYARRALPADAVVLAVQQSGSIRFHGRRDTIAWDAIPEDALDGYLARLRAAGRSPYLALEDLEEPVFRRRFAGQRAGALDSPPVATVRAPVRVRLYVPPS